MPRLALFSRLRPSHHVRGRGRILDSNPALFLLLALACGVTAMSARAEMSLKVVTEDFPPFQYIENGHLTGVCAEVVEAVLAEAGIEAEITVMPWPRAQKMAKEEENVLIFSMARTAGREKDYKWVGQIDEAGGHVFAAAGNPVTIRSFDDLKLHVLGVVIGDLREEFFHAQGFEDGKNLEPVRTHASLYSMLKAGRIELWPESDLTMAYVVRQAGGDPAKAVRAVWNLSDVTGYAGDFMAAGLSTPDEIIERLRAALDKVKSDGRYEAIMRKWGVGLAK